MDHGCNQKSTEAQRLTHKHFIMKQASLKHRKISASYHIKNSSKDLHIFLYSAYTLTKIEGDEQPKTYRVLNIHDSIFILMFGI